MKIFVTISLAFIVFAVSGKAGSAYQILENTTSPNGRFALAWQVEGVGDLEKYLERNGEINEADVRNVLLDLRTRKSITSLSSKAWPVQLKGSSSTSSVQAEWNAASNLVVIASGGEQGVHITAIQTKNGQLPSRYSFGEDFDRALRSYLDQEFPESFERLQNHLILHLSDLEGAVGNSFSTTDGGNSFAVTVTPGVSKAEHEGAGINTKLRVRFAIEKIKHSLELVILGIDKVGSSQEKTRNF